MRQDCEASKGVVVALLFWQAIYTIDRDSSQP